MAAAQSATGAGLRALDQRRRGVGQNEPASPVGGCWSRFIIVKFKKPMPAASAKPGTCDDLTFSSSRSDMPIDAGISLESWQRVVRRCSASSAAWSIRRTGVTKRAHQPQGQAGRR
jgi:hypothetical protein